MAFERFTAKIFMAFERLAFENFRAFERFIAFDRFMPKACDTQMLRFIERILYFCT